MTESTGAVTAIYSLFADGKSIFWAVFSMITLTGLGLSFVGQRYYKRFLFLVGALPTYVAIHCLAGKFDCVAEWHAVLAAVILGLCMVMLSWLFIYTFGFWTVVLIVGGLILGVVDFSGIGTGTYIRIGWLLACMGVAGGVFALIKQKHIIVIVTSLTGAFLATAGAIIMLAALAPSTFASLGVVAGALIVAFLVIAGSGIFVQYKYTGDKSKKIVVENGKEQAIPNKSRFKYVVLAFMFGYLGVHSFYAGQYKKGFVQLAISAFSGWLGWVPIIFMQLWALGSVFRASKNLGLKKS